MQNFATMLNTQNTVSMDDLIGTSQNYDTKNITEKGKDFFNILNRNDNKIQNINDEKNVKNDKQNKKTQTNKIDDSNQSDKVNFDKEQGKNKANTQEKNEIQSNEEIDKKNNDSQENRESVKNTDKTLDDIKAEPIVKEAQETSQANNMQVLSANEVIQETVNKINNLIETSLNGQLNLEDVEQLKNALEEIKTKINNNELAVSEDTKQMLNDVLNRLLTQNPKDMEVAQLQKDLKQLAQDIQVSAFKLNSQIKMEEENANPTKALEINVDETNTTITKETSKKEVNEEKITQKTKDSQTTVNASKDTKEVQNTQNNQTDIEQEILDEMDVKIEEVSDSSENTNLQNQSYTTAQDEVIKLQIQNSDNDTNTPLTFAFDKTIKNVSSINKPIQLEGVTKELNANDILNQIGSKFEQLKDGSSTKITMTLRPNDLGRVTIELLSNANGISTNIIAQNSQVKELLDKNIDILKQQLAQQGINVQNIQIKTVEQNSQAGLNNGYNEREQSQQENQSQNNKENNQNKQQEKRESFKFNKSNIIENIDFENNSQNTTTSINTLRGKISYNL